MTGFYYVPDEGSQTLTIYTKESKKIKEKSLASLNKMEIFGVMCHEIAEGSSLSEAASKSDRMPISEFLRGINLSARCQEMYRIAEKNRLRSLKERIVELSKKENAKEALAAAKASVDALSKLNEEDKTTTEYVFVDWNTLHTGKDSGEKEDNPSQDDPQTIPAKDCVWD